MDQRIVVTIAKKEFKHLYRDKRLLSILLFFPVFLLIIFGYAVNFDVDEINISVLDNSRSYESRELLRKLESSNYFTISKYIQNEREIKEALDNRKVQAILIIPHELNVNRRKGEVTGIQILLDGVDANSAMIIQNYFSAAIAEINAELLLEYYTRAGIKISKPINLEARFWFNPELRSTKFLIPGLIAMILVIISVVTVSLSLVREKEKGTMEQIYVSPITSTELMIGKTLPYILLSLINGFIIIGAGYLLFEVKVEGSIILLFLMMLLYIFSSTSLGIFVSAISGTQQIAFTIGTFASLLPSVILSGFIFPIDSMPITVQLFSNLTPAKPFVTILRGIILKGSSLSTFWEQAVILLMFGLGFLTAATMIFRRSEGGSG